MTDSLVKKNRPIIKNWGGNVAFTPQEIRSIDSVEQLTSTIKDCNAKGLKLRVPGSKHSFSQLICSKDVYLEVNLRGLISHRKESNEVTIWSGTKLHEVGPILEKCGLSLPNQGDVDRQSVAGAFSTGTHGTGLGFGCLARFATEIEFVDGLGQLHTVNESSPNDLLNAVRVNLGTFGVITKYTIKCDPLYYLHDNRKKLPLTECIDKFLEWAKENKQVEVFWFPYSRWAQVKRCNKTSLPKPRHPIERYLTDEVMERYSFEALCRLATLHPKLARAVSRLSGTLMPDSDFSDVAYKVYPTPRHVRFTEMEYSIPIEAYKECFYALKDFIEREKIQVFFPVELRVAGADEIWISPFYKRKSAIISLHTYKQHDYKRYFEGMEAIFKTFGGRPHWGKCHSLTRDYILTQLPKWPEFEKLRQVYDPNRIFLNEMLEPYFESGRPRIA
jgi:FAD-linked oxidoreductase